MRRMLVGLALLAVLYVAVPAQEKSELSPVTKSFITVDSPVIALAARARHRWHRSSGRARSNDRD